MKEWLMKLLSVLDEPDKVGGLLNKFWEKRKNFLQT